MSAVMLTLTLLLLGGLTLFSVLISIILAMIGAKKDAAMWVTIAILLSVVALLSGCEGGDLPKYFRCDGEMVETGKARIGGVWVPVRTCVKESER